MDSSVEEIGVSSALRQVKSEKIIALWSKIEESSSLNIKAPIDPEEWDDLMFLLGHEDVSGIKHLAFSTMGWDVKPWSEVAARRLGLTGLGTVLGTGRFSALKSLKIDVRDLCLLTPEYVVPLRLLHALGIASESIAAAFRTGQFANLRRLRLSIRFDVTQPRDVTLLTRGDEGEFDIHSAICETFDFNHMFEALVEGRVSKLASLDIYFTNYGGLSEAQSWSLRNLRRRSVAEKLEALLESGCLTNLRHLGIGGEVFAELEWTVLTNAIKSGLLPNLRSLALVGFSFDDSFSLADLVEGTGSWFSSLEHLTILYCSRTSKEVCAMVNAMMKLPKSESALKSLTLAENLLQRTAFDALANLIASGRLQQIEELDLKWNKEFTSGAAAVFERLMESIQGGRLPRLKTFDWRGNWIGRDGEVAEAVAEAYFENEALTADIRIDWDKVGDGSLVAKVKEYKKRNRRLVALRSQLEDEFKVLLPLSSAKVFLCGFPEVGKTTLRKALGRHLGLRTRFTSERRFFRFKEPRTKGIELSRIKDNSDTTLILWDLAGQEEFHVLHGTFLANLGFAGGEATTFVLVFKVPFDASVQANLLYWLKFVASSSVRSVQRQVMIVLNCFDGNQCPESERRYWMGLIEDFAAKFIDILHIHPEPFIIDVRVAALVQPLKHHLFHHAQTLLQDVRVPKACFELLKDLKQWSDGENKNRLPIFSWTAFEDGWKLKHASKDDPPKNLKICASYLHEIGEIIYLDDKASTHPGSRNKGIVVPDPEWFCKEVVGQLLLPKEMLEGGRCIQISADGSITLIRFRAFFEHLLPDGTASDDVVSMLEQVGLCLRKGTEEIIIPALIREDDYTSIDWEGQGSHGVMGRCLATEDTGRTAIPGTLFRRLQVELAQDQNFGGRGDSQYRAGKSFCSFKRGELLILVQFDVDHSDPSDDRIDVLVKSVLRGDSTDVSLAKVNVICEIIQMLERLCVTCCPGLMYDVKVIQPWNAPEPTPEMTERQLMSLREIKTLLVQGQKYSSWNLNSDPVELKTLLSDSELKGVLGSAQGEYDECKREAVSLGLLTEDSLQRLEEFEQENGAIGQGLDVEGATSKYQSDDGEDITNRQFLREVRREHRLTRKAVHKDGHLTRQYIEESQAETRQKQKVLVRHIQAQQEFSIEERERSVPRYIFLSRKQGKSNVWITLTQAFNESFELHLLCEAHFDDGFLHEVEGQEGIQLTRPKWLSNISPWLRRSLIVAVMVAKTTGNIYLPGVFNFIPDLNYLQDNGEASSKAVDIAATMMLEEDEGVNPVQRDNGNYGTAGAPVDLRERMIAEGVVKDLMREVGDAAFKKKIGLRKVLLRAADQPHVGSSTQAQSSEAQSCVRWICESCYKSYGDRASAIG